MDKNWYRNPSKWEVIGRCGGDEKRMTTQNRQMSNAKKIIFFNKWSKNGSHVSDTTLQLIFKLKAHRPPI